MIPRLLLAAPHKSSGKTTVTLGLCAALSQRGLHVQPFKKGPDYIDPMWLGAAAGMPCLSLDPYVQGEPELLSEFTRHAAACDVALIEGNMGLFDSLDVEGRHSNASLAALLDVPVVLVVDVRGATRSIVPLLLGFMQFDQRIRIAGVILNKVAGQRHEQRLREVIAHYTTLPVIGAIHRDASMAIDERHLGLIPSNEEQAAAALLTTIRDKVAAQVDLDALLAIARSASPLASSESALPPPPAPDVTIGIARDAAFGFYYPEDLARLQRAGATLVPFDTLQDDSLPEVDGLLIGGGFPETQMEALERNVPMHQAIREAIENGMPCYAECGGMMYLSRSISWQERQHQMVGIIPGDTVMHARPIGRGYVQLQPSGMAPWQANSASSPFSAHEFHYSTLENLPADTHFAYQVVRGAGIDGRHDGYVYKNLLANYAHLRDVEGTPWCERFVAFVRKIAAERRQQPLAMPAQ